MYFPVIRITKIPFVVKKWITHKSESPRPRTLRLTPILPQAMSNEIPVER